MLHIPRWTGRLPVVVALLLGATVAGGRWAASAPASVAGAHRTPAYEVGLTSSIASMLTTMHVPGAVVMVRTPSGNYSRAFGTRTVGGTKPIRLGDTFRIGSNTKTMTGTVILQLVQEHRLALTDPISKYVGGVPNGRHITITELLDMRSGLYNYSESLGLNQALDANPARAFSPGELLKIAFAHEPYFSPNQGYHYSNTNTVLLGLTIERLTRRPVASAFAARIFRPLGLTRTVFPARRSLALPAPFAHGYMYGTNVETISTSVLSPAQQAAANAGTLRPGDQTHGNPSWGWTAGAGISNGYDLVRYVRALVGGGLLDPAMQRLRLASVRPVDPRQPNGPEYGLGIAKFGPLYGHTGELPGYQTFMGYDPVRKITVVVLTSLSAAPDGTPPANVISKLIMGRIYGPTSVGGSPTTPTQ